MSTFSQLYESVEKTFWNSLTKKLCSFLLLFFIDIFYLGIYLRQKSEVASLLAAGQVSPETVSRITGSLDAGLYAMLVLTALALVVNIGQSLSPRHPIGRGPGAASRPHLQRDRPWGRRFLARPADDHS
jgi:methyl-accepting chemotaxis protein